LELAFDSKPLRAICESAACAERTLGARVAEVLRHRLADLRAATSPKDLVAGSPSLLDGAEREHMAVNLCDGWRLVFAANHPKNPRTENGDLDWVRISRIRILRIETIP
jgi:plasmid maintenance system killer protein